MVFTIVQKNEMLTFYCHILYSVHKERTSCKVIEILVIKQQSKLSDYLHVLLEGLGLIYGPTHDLQTKRTKDFTDQGF